MYVWWLGTDDQGLEHLTLYIVTRAVLLFTACKIDHLPHLIKAIFPPNAEPWK